MRDEEKEDSRRSGNEGRESGDCSEGGFPSIKLGIGNHRIVLIKGRFPPGVTCSENLMLSAVEGKYKHRSCEKMKKACVNRYTVYVRVCYNCLFRISRKKITIRKRRIKIG